MGKKPAPSPESEPEEFDEDSDTDSEDDYELVDNEVNILSQVSNLQPDVVLDLWKAQRGLCRASDLPMSFNSGFYQCTIAPRIVNKPISESNAVMVCKVVEDMRQATGLSWKAFVSLLNNVTKDEF